MRCAFPALARSRYANRAARKALNPQTGVEMMLKASRVPKFGVQDPQVSATGWSLGSRHAYALHFLCMFPDPGFTIAWNCVGWRACRP
jgi:hypothetical protein